MTGVSIQ